jgi:citrate lyase subunit beta / citryl-CoA lyase
MPIGGVTKPLRSITFNVDEGKDLSAMARAYELGSDAVTFDLEDHVPRPQLPTARANIRTLIRDMGASKPTFVRVNKLTSPESLGDLEAVVTENLYGVFAPKVADAGEIMFLDRLLTMFEKRAGLEEGAIVIAPLLESASGIHQAFDVSTCSRRVEYIGCCVSRNGDPAISVGFEWTPDMSETVYIRQKVLLEARAAGIKWPVSGIWNPVNDLEGLEAFATQSRRIGYFGLVCLPLASHVEVINKVFTPTQDEIDYWAEVVPIIDAAETDVFVPGGMTGAVATLAGVPGEPLPPNKAKWGRRRMELAAHFGITPSSGRERLAASHVGSFSTHINTISDGAG